MSDLDKLLRDVLEKHFGLVVSTVCMELCYGSKPLKNLSSATKYSIAKVKQALSVLIQFEFVSFNTNTRNICEYAINNDNILTLLRYPRYLAFAYEKYGKIGKLIITELLLNAKMPLSSIILQIADIGDLTMTPAAILDYLRELTRDEFVIRVGSPSDDLNPTVIPVLDHYSFPEIDLKVIEAILRGQTERLPDQDMYWKVNFDRFHHEFRNELFVECVKRRVDAAASVAMKHVMKLNQYGQHLSNDFHTNPLSVTQLKESMESDADGLYAVSYLDAYLKVMEENTNQMIQRLPEFNGGIVVKIKEGIEKFVFCNICSIVERRFGPKFARIFRLVYSRKQCELEQIQQIAMIPDKEAKYMAFKLLEENFFELVELKKPSTACASATTAKVFFLFTVNLKNIAQMILRLCYKELRNVMTRQREERDKCEYIFRKEEEMTNTASNIGNHFTPPEKCLLDASKEKIKKLQLAELRIDETVFLLKYYNSLNENNASVARERTKIDEKLKKKAVLVPVSQMNGAARKSNRGKYSRKSNIRK